MTTTGTTEAVDPRLKVAALLCDLVRAETAVRNAKVKEQEAKDNLNQVLDEIGMAKFPKAYARVEERTAAYLDLGDKCSEAMGKSKTYWFGRARTARERMINAQENFRQLVLDSLVQKEEAPDDGPR